MELSPDITSEDLQAFLQEADEQLQLLDEDIVKLERDHNNPELIKEIFRAAHTLKGSSGMLGHQRMTELAHHMETLLDKVRRKEVPVSTEVVDALLHSLDALTMLKEELVSPGLSEVDIAASIAELEVVLNAGNDPSQTAAVEVEIGKDDIVLSVEDSAKLEAVEESEQTAYSIEIKFVDSTDWAAVRCFQLFDALGQICETVASSPTQEDVQEERVGKSIALLVIADSDEPIKSAVAGIEDVERWSVENYVPGDIDESTDSDIAVESAASEGAGNQQRSQAAQTVRIDVEKLDDLMNLIGELVIDRTRIVQISKVLETRYREDEMVQAISKTSEHIEKVVDELQESTMKVRMLPIGTVFNGFPRLMRDLAQKVNKQVNFVVDGQDTEIDRTVIDRIRDPLVHLLRNSVDHGVESAEDRIAAGKPEMGTIKLSAYHEQGHIVIRVDDDGKGIDAQKVKESAVNKGLITAEVAARLSDAEALDLIFLPGASTAAKTTDISGRGVGMDIVKSNIEAINGFVKIETKVGEGTSFILRLPLTLATLQALLVELDDTTYAVPLVYVLEAVSVNRDEITTIEGHEVCRLRGDVIPLLKLRTVLALDEAETGAESEQAWVVVVRFGEKLVGLAVDTLIELQEIVVKSLGNYIGDVKGVAGASILGDGRVVLILDIATLMNLAMQLASKVELAMQK